MAQPKQFKNAISAYSIACLNAFKLRYYAENDPDMDVYSFGVNSIDYEILYRYSEVKKIASNVSYDPTNLPSIQEFYVLLGRLVGFRPTKYQPFPGLKILGKALKKINWLIDSYLIFNPQYAP